MQLERVAFMSYDHENDRLDQGYLSRFRERLEAQVTALMGEEFTIFQDRTHIHTGHDWQERIRTYLSKSTFLMPIITPHFFKSEWCRKEFHYFRRLEQEGPSGKRIIPIYYIDCREMKDSFQFPLDSMERQLHDYEYADWRILRDYGINTSSAVKRMRQIARHVHDLFEELASDQRLRHNSVPISQLQQHARVAETYAASASGAPFDFMMLPALTGFIGRSSELAWVIERLTAPDHPHLASLDGVDAIGKSSVAAKAAHILNEHACFPNGIGVVLCTDTVDFRVVLRNALTRFDPDRRPPSGNDEAALTEQAYQLLSGKRTLIVLDDVDSRLDIARVLGPLQKAGAALLLTSKNPLSVPKGLRRTLEPPEKPEAVDLLTAPVQS